MIFIRMVPKRPIEESSIEQEIQSKKQKLSKPPTNIRYTINNDKKVLFKRGNITKKLPDLNYKVMENIHGFITIEEINNNSKIVIESGDGLYIYKKAIIPRKGDIYTIEICSNDEEYIKNTLYMNFSLKKFSGRCYADFIVSFYKDFQKKYPNAGKLLEEEINPHNRDIDSYKNDRDDVVHPIIPILKKHTNTNIPPFKLDDFQKEQLYKKYCDCIAELLSGSEIELN